MAILTAYDTFDAAGGNVVMHSFLTSSRFSTFDDELRGFMN